MADTRRTLTEILALFSDNNTGKISAQDLRDYVVSALRSRVTNVVAATHDITVDDCILHIAYTNTGAVAITWPVAQMTDEKIIDIKDADGNAAVNNITITPAAGTIDGNANLVININKAAYTIYCYDGNLYIK